MKDAYSGSTRMIFELTKWRDDEIKLGNMEKAKKLQQVICNKKQNKR